MFTFKIPLHYLQVFIYDISRMHKKWENSTFVDMFIVETFI